MTISTRALDIRNRRPQAKIGQLAESDDLNDVRTVINSDPQAAQVSTILIDTATNSATYTVTVDEVDVSIVADASATKPEIADALADALNQEPSVYGRASSASDGVATVTMTGQYPGVAFVLSDDDAKLTTADVTAADEADAVEFGRLVISGGYQTDEANELGIKVKSSALDAQIDSMVVTYAAAELYGVSIKIDGEEYGVEVAADTDTDTTGAAIVTAINAMMPANTVLAAYTAGTDTVSLTAEVAGKAFSTSRWLKSGTVARLTLVHTLATVDSDINKVALGVSVYTTDEENTTEEGDDVVYPANAGVQILRKGLIWVASAQSVSRGEKVYVETGVTASNGKFYNTASATRLLLDGATWERASRSSSGDNIALLSIDF